MDPSHRPASQTLFQVYLRLRPPLSHANVTYQPLQELSTERFIIVEPPSTPIHEPEGLEQVATSPTHITLQPPTDSRKRAVEKFAFTKVFEEEASQLDLFTEAGVVGLVRGVLGGEKGADGLVATLGVTGSGKSHTILGSKSQRGLTQMSLDMLFQSLGETVQSSATIALDPALVASLAASDPSEAKIIPAQNFLESTYGDAAGQGSRAHTPMISSRAQTPMTVWHPQKMEFPILPPSLPLHPSSVGLHPKLLGLSTGVVSPRGRDAIVTPTIRMVPSADIGRPQKPQKDPLHQAWSNNPIITRKVAKHTGATKEVSFNILNPSKRHALPPQPSELPQTPDVSEFALSVDPNASYVVLISMYEVYNDRIFDLLSSSNIPAPSRGMTTRQGTLHQKDMRRRPLLFKSTEASPDRKIVAGLRKIICSNYEEAVTVLETGLLERRIAGTGSNSVSSRSHGFFCVEVKKKLRPRRFGGDEVWDGKTLTIVDLAGSERARNAKTAGATLAEAGKINESLMYLGQCLQMQSDCQEGAKQLLVPFRQCKLTELLFANSLTTPSPSSQYRTQPQKSIMIVTADPHGDFNATSQILRYSALAREVTVPRIPSVTSTIFSGSVHTASSHQNPVFSYGRTTPYLATQEELELAAAEIARLTEECDALAVRATEEEIRADEAELRLRAAEEKAEMIEVEVREEVWGEVEVKLEEERRRWMGVREEERGCIEGFLDRKIELLGKTVGEVKVKVFEDGVPGVRERNEELERENEILREKIKAMEREIQGRSPTKAKKSNAVPCRMGGGADENIPYSVIGLVDDGEEGTAVTKTVLEKFEGLRLGSGNANVATSSAIRVGGPMRTPARTPSKKIRKLTTRKWDLGPEEEIP